MPKLKLLTNLGTADARRAGLDRAKSREGRVVEVADPAAAEHLIKHGWAEAVGGAGPVDFKAVPPAGLEAVPPVEVKAEGDAEAAGADDGPPDFDAMTKEEIKEYADAHKYQGIGLAMTKDEMVRQAKRQASRQK